MRIIIWLIIALNLVLALMAFAAGQPGLGFFNLAIAAFNYFVNLPFVRLQERKQ